MSRKGPAILVLSLAAWMLLVSDAVLALSWSNPTHRAVIGMAWGLIVLWIFVYGLMVWLPAYCVPAERSARPPRWWAYPLAVVIPFLFLPLMAVLAPWLWLTPKHPPIHFPAIQ
jgi:hypothetical protein